MPFSPEDSSPPSPFSVFFCGIHFSVLKVIKKGVVDKTWCFILMFIFICHIPSRYFDCLDRLKQNNKSANNVCLMKLGKEVSSWV